jgi:lauroyl/myristoyl acyltransferase
MDAQTFKETLSAWLLRFVGRIGMILPQQLADGFIFQVGRLFGRLPILRTKQMGANIRLLFDYPEEKIKELVPEIFGNFALTLFHFFSPKGIQVVVKNKEKLEEVRARHKGFMILTFHIGHWELGARKVSEWDWPITAVYQEYKSRSFQKLIESLRAPKVQYVPVGAGAARGVAEVLKKGEIIAMLGDHAFGENGIPVRVLGHEIFWPKGPALLALRENAPIVVALVHRLKGRLYEALIEDPIYPQGHTREEIHRLVQEIADKFGRLLPDHVSQWYRFMPLERQVLNSKL